MEKNSGFILYGTKDRKKYPYRKKICIGKYSDNDNLRYKKTCKIIFTRFIK
jgi:hypothetical protein